MRCKRCGKAIETFGINNLWKHSDTDSITCIHDSVPMFASPQNKQETLRQIKKWSENTHR